MIIRHNYTAINTREELKRAVELGLKVYLSDKGNPPDSGYIEPRNVTFYFPGAPGHFDWFRWRALGEHDLSEPKPEQPEQPEPAQFALGDIVEIVETPVAAQVEPGTLARVARIANSYGVKLLGLEGPNGETLWEGVDGLLWALPEHLAHADAPKDEQPERAESEKPEPAEEPRSFFENDPVAFVREVLGVEPDQWQQDMLNAIARGERPSEPEFRITVVIEATSARGYREALTVLGEGV